MSDTQLLHAVSANADVLSGPGIHVVRAAPMIRFAFRGDAVAAGKAGASFGASLPMSALQANAVADRAAIWLGPDEWLLLARPQDDDPADVWTAAMSIGADMAAALGEAPHALVDVSERSDALIVSGARATALLNTQIFLDLDEAAFPLGTATRTLFAKAEIVLWRVGPDRFMIECWNSFVPYVEELLCESARGL